MTEFFFAAGVVLVALLIAKTRAQQQRIALLGRYLGQYRIEKLMETVTEGYLRALGESDAERQEPIWNLMRTAEEGLAEQFTRFANEFSRIDAQLAQVSRLPVAIPFMDRLVPDSSFDMRAALQIHARGIARLAAHDTHLRHKDRAYTLSAELFLMQHTCHWFCRSKSVASARLAARHKTTYPQVVAAVSQETREAYLALIRR